MAKAYKFPVLQLGDLPPGFRFFDGDRELMVTSGYPTHEGLTVACDLKTGALVGMNNSERFEVVRAKNYTWHRIAWKLGETAAALAD